MDRGIWAIWYDLPEHGEDEYLKWLHERYIPEALSRHGYLWAAHVRNLTPEERFKGAPPAFSLTHTDDADVPTGNRYLLLFGAEHPHIFANPSPAEMVAKMSVADREMLDVRVSPRSHIFVEVERVDGPEVDTRAPGITPGPTIQLGTFNINALENEDELCPWYSRSRLPLLGPMTGAVGARKLVSISGWAKHAILYEFVSIEANQKYFVDNDREWTSKVIRNLIHAPGSPTLGQRIWPA